MNHPNRSKQQQAQPINPYIEGFKAGRKDGEEIRAELLAALNGLLNCFNSNGEIEETTQDQLSVALENAEKAQAKAEGR